MNREMEFKVLLDSKDAAALTGELPQGQLLVGPPSKRELRSIYFDTPAHDLQKAGISLRLRQQEDSWLQTIKTGRKLSSGVSNSVELDTEVKTARPRIRQIADIKLRGKLERAINGSTLTPIFETLIQRTTRVVQANGSVIGLAVDEGEVKAGKSIEPVSEAELELKSGRVEDLLLAAEVLLSGHRFEISNRTKSERGYELALGKNQSSAVFQKAKPVRLTRELTSTQAFTDIIASAAQQIVVNRTATLETDDPEAAHQLRVGLRRLRSALFALKPIMKSETLRAFDEAARDLGRSVGTLRDADVLSSDILSPLESKHPAGIQYSELREALTQERIRRRDYVRAALDGPQWRKLHVHLSLWPTMLKDSERLQKPIERVAHRALKKSWKKSKDLGDEIDVLRGERRHELRKALKKLRYQAEFFLDLYPRTEAQAFIKNLKSLQKLFGYVNDARMSTQLLEIASDRNVSLKSASAAGFVVGYHEAEASQLWSGAKTVWKELRNSKQFWRH